MACALWEVCFFHLGKTDTRSHGIPARGLVWAVSRAWPCNPGTSLAAIGFPQFAHEELNYVVTSLRRVCPCCVVAGIYIVSEVCLDRKPQHGLFTCAFGSVTPLIWVLGLDLNLTRRVCVRQLSRALVLCFLVHIMCLA